MEQGGASTGGRQSLGNLWEELHARAKMDDGQMDHRLLLISELASPKPSRPPMSGALRRFLRGRPGPGHGAEGGLNTNHDTDTAMHSIVHFGSPP
ncbi:hypothetical protein Ct61P_04589 [Colletotrichum tofieldiae]|nr:hypothetical protein Ct61P_04589 [Colletotrichum tofieldiae]